MQEKEMALFHDVHPGPGVTSRLPSGSVQFGIVLQAIALIDWALIVTLTIACGLVYDLTTFGHPGEIDRYVRMGIAAATVRPSDQRGRANLGDSFPVPRDFCVCARRQQSPLQWNGFSAFRCRTGRHLLLAVG